MRNDLTLEVPQGILSKSEDTLHVSAKRYIQFLIFLDAYLYV